MVRSSSSRQRSPAGGTPIGTRATAHMATAKPSPTTAAEPSGMVRPVTDDQCASMSTASQPYPTVIRTKATRMQRQKRSAAGSSGACRHSRHTATTARKAPTGRKVNEIASLPAPTVTYARYQAAPAASTPLVAQSKRVGRCGIGRHTLLYRPPAGMVKESRASARRPAPAPQPRRDAIARAKCHRIRHLVTLRSVTVGYRLGDRFRAVGLRLAGQAAG